MEIERIQSVKGLKVERTGSEQERRRRPQTEEAFSELLESSMSDENTDDESRKEPPPNRDRAHDTVSFASDTLPPPTVISDLVSISSTAIVGSEMHNASRSIDDSAPTQRGPDKYIREQVIDLRPAEAPVPGDTEPDSVDGEEEPPVKIDTLA